MKQFPSENQISTNWKRKRQGLIMVYKKHFHDFNKASIYNPLKLIAIITLYYFGNGAYKIFDMVR